MRIGEKLLRGLDALTNIAILGAAVAVMAIGWYRYGPGTTGAAPERRAAISIKTGGQVPVEGVDWKGNRRTVVLVLSTTCPHCADSASFYRQISAHRKKGLRIVAVFAEAVPTAQSFLSEHQVEVDQVLQRPPDKIGVRGVPAVLLVGATGKLDGAWLGKVGPSTEEKILRQLED